MTDEMGESSIINEALRTAGLIPSSFTFGPSPLSEEPTLDDLVAWAEIDLDAIALNVRAFARHVGPGVALIAVVKGNAYGHGAVPVSLAAVAAGATHLAVHRVLEGAELRRAGITAPTLVMGYTPPGGADAIVHWQLTPAVMTIEFAQALAARAVAGGVVVPVHVKLDTGMSRFGLMPEEMLPFLHALCALPGLRLEGLFTHLATADAADPYFTRQQLSLLRDVLAAAQDAGIHIPIVHAANSAAIMRLPESWFNAVRPGIAMYGLVPTEEWPTPFEIHPALTLKSRVGRVRELPAGAGISYSRTFVTDRPTRVALVAIGYGDGYHRILSNKGSVLIRGRRAPILGRICMDQFIVDVSHIPGVCDDDEVVLIGRQQQGEIRAEEVACLAGTINYEVTTSLLPRVARVFLQGGEIVGWTR